MWALVTEHRTYVHDGFDPDSEPVNSSVVELLPGLTLISTADVYAEQYASFVIRGWWKSREEAESAQSDLRSHGWEVWLDSWKASGSE